MEPVVHFRRLNMNCTNDHEIAQALHKQYLRAQRETTSYFRGQHTNTYLSQECHSACNDPVNAAHEKRLLQGKPRQQYHDDNLKVV